MSAWDGNGNGSDIQKPFAAEGKLPNRALIDDSKLPTGALCFEAELAANSSVTVPFALAWFFPQIEFGKGTRWWRRFTEYFPPKTGQ